jgi:acyl-coenzyme A synthetase/AMP-(fatty) acid ligase
VIHEDETGAAQTLTYAELAHEVDRVARGLRSWGVGACSSPAAES